MVFLGYNFYSNVNALSPTPASGRMINAIKIFDGQYYSIFASANPNLTLGNIGDVWDYDTKLMTNFDTGTLDAGNSAFSLVNTEQIVIKRRAIDEQKWIVIYVKNIKTVDDFNIFFMDKYARSGIEYEYAVSSISGGIENSYVVKNVYSEFDGFYITDKDCLYGTIYNIDTTPTTMNLSNSVLSLLNSKYMTVSSNSETRAETGSTSGVFLKLDEQTGEFDRRATLAYRTEVKNRLANKKPLILKIHDGRIWMIRVTGQPTDSSDGHFDVRTLTFEWAEIGDYNDMETLYKKGFSDVGSGWW